MQQAPDDPLGRLKAAKELARQLTREPARLKAPSDTKFNPSLAEELTDKPLAELAIDYLHMQELYREILILAIPDNLPDKIIASLPELMHLPPPYREINRKGKHMNVMNRLTGILRKVSADDAQPEDWYQLQTALKPCIHYLEWMIDAEKGSPYRPENSNDYAIGLGIKAFQKANVKIDSSLEDLEFVGRNSPRSAEQEEIKQIFSDGSRLTEHIANEMLANLKELNRLVEKAPPSRTARRDNSPG